MTERTGTKSLSKTVINFWLDAFLMLLFLAVLWVTSVLRFVFPAPTAAVGWQLWNLDFNQWSDLQFGLICLLAFSILVHVMLHWSWVCGVIAGRMLRRRQGKKKKLDDGTRTLWGVGLLIALLNGLGIALAAAMLTIQRP